MRSTNACYLHQSDHVAPVAMPATPFVSNCDLLPDPKIKIWLCCVSVGVNYCTVALWWVEGGGAEWLLAPRRQWAEVRRAMPI